MTKEQFKKVKESLDIEDKVVLNKWIQWFYDSDRFLYYDFYDEVEVFIRTTFPAKHKELMK